MKKARIFFTATFAVLLVRCGDRPPDIDHISVNTDIHRFDQALFDISLDRMRLDIDSLALRYPDFMPLFNHKIVKLGDHSNQAYPDYLRRFVTDYFVYQAYKKVQQKFTDLEWLENDLNRSFRYFQYYFPDKSVPAFYTFIGGFNQSIVTADSLIGIGLDKYLGADEEFYLRMDPPFPQYQRRRMRPENMLPDCMQAWLVTEFPYDDSTDNLVNNIIYEGKIAYAMEKVMPEVHDTLLFNFTQNQLTFCEKNEKMIWTYLIENKLLFDNDKFMIRKFVGEAPFTKDFSRDSPGRAVVWLGREIVASYMKRHKGYTLYDLVNNDHYQQILNESGYNP